MTGRREVLRARPRALRGRREGELEIRGRRAPAPDDARRVAVRLPPVERVVQGAPDVAGRRFGETELDPVPLEHQLAPRGVHGAAQVGDGESPRLPGPRVREDKAPVADVVRRFGGGRALDGHVERHELVRLVPGIRTLISVPAGVELMPITPFLIWTTAGSLIWTLLLTIAGIALGESYSNVEIWIEPLSKVIKVILMIGLVSSFILLGLRISKKNGN